MANQNKTLHHTGGPVKGSAKRDFFPLDYWLVAFAVRNEQGFAEI